MCSHEYTKVYSDHGKNISRSITFILNDLTKIKINLLDTSNSFMEKCKDFQTDLCNNKNCELIFDQNTSVVTIKQKNGIISFEMFCGDRDYKELGTFLFSIKTPDIFDTLNNFLAAFYYDIASAEYYEDYDDIHNHT